jgi:predicted GNAT superfamily acetyltransferase
MSQVLSERKPAVAVTIRDVVGADELRSCQMLQRRAWGITEDGYVLPVATMAGAQKVGGLILGAFDQQTDQLIGFAFAFLGKLRGLLILYSQLTGVHPAHQSRGVGRLLKYEQRRRAAELGVGAVVWAFDPLQASNAAFNLGVLGASCRTYEIDMYGSRSDVLNAGLATDRLLAEWTIGGDVTPGPTVLWPDAFEVIESEPTESSRVMRVRRVQPIPTAARRLRIKIPASIVDVKSFGPTGAARDWQLAVRESFQAAFDAAFVAVGFSRADPLDPCYLLERMS